ncbi:MAG: enoyl-CoA hydratase-related protein [Rhodococcus sp. (in: high G+C Gram-positive bacteria)]
MLHIRDDVHVLDLGDGENRLDPDSIAAAQSALDKIDTDDGPAALLTVAHGKFFSNGLDLEWLSAHRDQHSEYIANVHALYARILSLPLITVAAVQGHAFGAGAMLALAHDFRVMREDRGFWCLPEIDIDLPFTRGMAALVQCKMSPRTAHEAMLTGRRYSGADALNAGIVDRVEPESSVLDVGFSLARANVNKGGRTMGIIKERMHTQVLAVLRDTTDPRG